MLSGGEINLGVFRVGFSGFVVGKWRGAGVRLLTHSNCEAQAQVYRG